MVRKKFFYIFLSLLFTFIITEITVRVILFKYFNNKPPRIDCSSCWRICWVSNYLKKEEGPPSVNIGIYDKTKGWDLRPNLKQCIIGNMIINTNSKGLRGIKEYSYDKPAGRKRIVMIGNSFTLGIDNNDDEIFPYFLDEMMPNIDVLNLGVGGYGHDQILLKLKEQGVKYYPDIVVLFFMPCDIHRNILTFHAYAKPRYALKNNKLILKNVPVDTAEEIIKREGSNLYFVDLLKILAYIIRDKMGLVKKEEIELTETLIKEMKNTCEKIDAEFVIIAFMDEKNLVEKLAGSDVTLLFLDVSDTPIPDAFEEHWNSFGHKLVAKKLFKGLLKYRLISPEDLVMRVL